MKRSLLLITICIVAGDMAAQTLVTSPSTPTPTPTSSPSTATSTLPEMFVPDGQLVSAPVRVYVSPANLDEATKPRLQLLPFKDWEKTKDKDLSTFRDYEPRLVASNQSWTEKIAGQSVQRHGTLLVFDLTEFEMAAYKSTTRVTPVFTWQPADSKPGSAKPKLVGPAIYLGNFRPAVGWTALIVIILLTFIARMAKKSELGVLSILSGPDNYLSLWRTQLAAWTIAIGSMVFLFGIIQFQVPRIPDSLVILMGLSIATGSLSSVADKSKTQNMGAPAPAARAKEPHLFHLISSYDPNFNEVVLSIPKAQMVFWTGIILILFVLKSWLNGELWEVPTELVTLTGVSQAGYITDKAIASKK